MTKRRKRWLRRLAIGVSFAAFAAPASAQPVQPAASGGGMRLAEELHIPLLGSLPIDTRVALGGERGEPIVVGVPEGEHAKVFLDVAAHVALHCAKLASTGPVRSSLLRTV